MTDKIYEARQILKEIDINHEVKLKTVDYIRGLFDDIEALRISKKAKTKEIYKALIKGGHLNNMSYEYFISSLSKIRREKGLYARQPNKKKYQ